MWGYYVNCDLGSRAGREEVRKDRRGDGGLGTGEGVVERGLID